VLFFANQRKIDAMRMKRESPFETQYRSYTSDPAGLAVALRDRQSQRERIESLPHVETMPRLSEIREDFKLKGLKLPSSDIATIERHRHIEQILVDDLLATYADNNTVERNAIRRLIWAISSKLNRNVDPNDAFNALLRHIRDTETEQTFDTIANAGNTEELDDRLVRLNDVKDGLKMDVYGDDLESAAETLEGEFSSALNAAAGVPLEELRAKIRQDLSDLRLIRDEVYFRLLFPNQARASEEAREHQKKRAA
jgi:hypothetical protein